MLNELLEICFYPSSQSIWGWSIGKFVRVEHDIYVLCYPYFESPESFSGHHTVQLVSGRECCSSSKNVCVNKYIHSVGHFEIWLVHQWRKLVVVSRQRTRNGDGLLFSGSLSDSSSRRYSKAFSIIMATDSLCFLCFFFLVVEA